MRGRRETAIAPVDGGATAPERADTTWRLVVVLGALLLVLAAVVPVAVGPVVVTVLLACSGVCVLARRRDDLGDTRLLHLLLCTTVWLVATGRVVAGATPTPSEPVAYGLTLAGYLVGAGGLVLILRRRARPGDGAGRVTLATLLPLLVMVALLPDTGQRAVTLGYAAPDLVVVALASMAVLQPRRLTTPLVLLLLAVGVSAVVDITGLVLGLLPGRATELLAQLPSLLLAAAAVHPEFRDVADLRVPSPSKIALTRATVLGVSLTVLLVVGLLEVAVRGGDAGLPLAVGGLLATAGVLGALRRTQCDLGSEQDAERRRLVTDPVTGLWNLQGLTDAAVAADAATWSAIAVDLHGFRALNEAFGFDVGDDALAATGASLRAGAADAAHATLVGRHAADAFVVLAADASDDGVRALAERLLAGLRDGVPTRGPLERLALDGAAGYAVGDPVADRTEPSVALGERIRQAVTAVARAKDAGPGTVTAYVPSMAIAASDEVELTQALDRTLRTDPDQLRVAHQPIIDLASGAVVAVEALIRWTRPDGSHVLPARLVALAEASGLVGRLGAHVMAQACRDVAVLRRQAPELRLHVNVSPLEADDVGFVGRVLATLAEHGLPNEALVLEVTEGVLLERASAARAALQELAEEGVRLALDDFGTGYASIGYLRQLDLAAVKVDRSFVAAHDTDAGLLADTVALLRSRVGCVVAEGVEEPGQLAAVTALGCELGQGWLLGRPTSVEEVAARLCGATRRTTA